VAKGSDEDQYEVDVRDQEGICRQTLKWARVEGLCVFGNVESAGFDGKFRSRPAKSEKVYRARSDVSKLYDLNAPGKYFIRVQRADPESFAILKSNTVRVNRYPFLAS
jgi:hypothetical protein